MKACSVTEKFTLLRKKEAALLKRKGRHRYTYRIAIIQYLSHLQLPIFCQDYCKIVLTFSNSSLFTFSWDFFSWD